jgi:hypothetical protein
MEGWIIIGTIAAVIAALTGIILVIQGWVGRRDAERDRVQLNVTAWLEGVELRVAVTNAGRHGSILRRGYLRWGDDPNALENTRWDVPVAGLVVPAGGTPVRIVDLTRHRARQIVGEHDPRWIGVEDDAGNVASVELSPELRAAIASPT